VKRGTKGFEEPIDAKFDVLEGKQYVIDVPSDQLPSSRASEKVPLDLLEARNAVVIAKAAGAQQYAPDSLTKAEDMLQRAEDYYQRKQGRTPIGTAARGATQMAEDARVLTLRRIEQAKIDADRQAHEEAQAKAEADAATAQQQAAQAQAQSEDDARRRAEAERGAGGRASGTGSGFGTAAAGARPRQRRLSRRRVWLTSNGRKRFSRKKRCGAATGTVESGIADSGYGSRADRQHAGRVVRFQQI